MRAAEEVPRAREDYEEERNTAEFKEEEFVPGRKILH